MNEGIHIGLDDKIQLVEIDKNMDDYKVFGIIPQDFEIYKNMHNLKDKNQRDQVMNFCLEELDYKNLLDSGEKGSK